MKKKVYYSPPITSIDGLFTLVAPGGASNFDSISRSLNSSPGFNFKHVTMKAPVSASNETLCFSSSLSTKLPENVSLKLMS